MNCYVLSLSFSLSHQVQIFYDVMKVYILKWGQSILVYPVADSNFNSLLHAGEGITVLVIGGGGREHALCYGLQQSSTCDAVFCAPGNPGIAAAGDATCIPDLDITTSSCVVSFCQKKGVGLVVVGPEAPLVAGLVDDLQAAGIIAFGPSAKAAALEGSKDFMKRLCIKYDIPTAKVLFSLLFLARVKT